MQKRIVFTLLAGILSALCAFLPNGTFLLGIWTPFVPLMLWGLAEGSRAAFHAGLIAIAVSWLVGGDQAGLGMAVAVVLPVNFLLNRLLRHQKNAAGQTQWYPTLRAVTELSLLPVGLFMIFALLTLHGETHNLRNVLKTVFTMDLSTVEPDTAELMRKLINEWSYAIFALFGWLWVLLTWFIAWGANFILVERSSALRQNVSLTPKGIPLWLPALLAISAILALSGQDNDSFAGKVAFLMLLLPYFLSGMAFIHGISHVWRARSFWLFLIYIILIFLFWTALFVVGIGFYLQFSEMLDKRQKMR